MSALLLKAAAMRPTFFSSLMHVAPHPSSHVAYEERNTHNCSELTFDLSIVVVDIIISFIIFQNVTGYEEYLTLTCNFQQIRMLFA